MADNITALANTGTGTDVLATDEIGGVHFPRTKIVIGGDGVNGGDVSAGNPMPVDMAALDPVIVNGIPDNEAAGLAARLVGEEIWNVGFSATGSSLLAPEMTQRTLGTGVTVSQASGNLVVAAGTTARAEFLARSVRTFRGSLLLRLSTVLSQRIANNNFMVLLADRIGEGLACTINSATSITVTFPSGHGFTSANVGQFAMIGAVTGAAGVPGRYAISAVSGDAVTFTVAGWPASGSCTVDVFGHSHIRVLYSSTVATNALFDAQRNGWQSGDTTLTINTTAAPGLILQVHSDGRNVYVSDSLRASALTPNVVVRGSRMENLPDDNKDLHVYLWSYNGATAPASGTSWTISFCAVEKFANIPVYVQGQRMQGNAAPAPVTVMGTVPVSGTVTATVGTSITGGTISPLTVAGVSIEASSAKVATGNSAAAITNASGNGAVFFINVTAASGTTPTLVVRFQVQDPVGLGWVDIPGAVTATITGTGLTMLTVCPGIIEAANSRVSFPLPRTFRAAWVIGGTTPSFTFSVGAQYII